MPWQDFANDGRRGAHRTIFFLSKPLQDSNDTTGDIVTFEVPGEKAALHALPLATVDPQVGDEVWVYGKELGKFKPVLAPRAVADANLR